MRVCPRELLELPRTSLAVPKSQAAYKLLVLYGIANALRRDGAGLASAVLVDVARYRHIDPCRLDVAMFRPYSVTEHLSL